MIDHNYDNECKVYVDVVTRFHKEGLKLNDTIMMIEPISFIWEDGTEYQVDRVLDVRRAASLKAGGAGIRYTVKVLDRETYLFLEEDKWFMERRVKT